MALAVNDITLQPIEYRRAIIGHIWEDFCNYSVEAITANRGGVYDFAEMDCMYFAVIKRKVQVPVANGAEEEGKNDPYLSASEDDFNPWGLRPLLPHIHNHSSGGSFVYRDETIGIIYLTSAELTGCVNLGCCILPDLRKKGYGTQAVRLLMEWAFEDLRCHRVQVRIADADASRRNTAIKMLLSLGFFFEGVARRSLFCPTQVKSGHDDGLGGEWQDVSTYALLDTDWVTQKNMTYIPPALVKVRWEDLFRRHEFERSAMLTFEEHQERKGFKERNLKSKGKSPLKRTSSMETVKDVNTSDSERSLDIPPEVKPYTSTGTHSWFADTFLPDNSQMEATDDHLEDLLNRRDSTSPDHAAFAHSSHDRDILHPQDHHRDPFTFIPSSVRRLRSTGSSVASAPYHSEDEFHSSASSPLLPQSPLIPGHESDRDSDWEVNSIPRSPSVLSSNESTSSWDLWSSGADSEYGGSVHSLPEDR